MDTTSMNQPQDAPLGKRLVEAQRAALNFLLLSSHSIGCLRACASGLSRIKLSTGTVEAPLVAEAMAKATLCRDSLADLDGVYSEAWSLLVDANRPPTGQPLAFQKVYEMAQALCASLDRVLSSTPEPETVDLVIEAARYQLCTGDEATALWTTINQEFAIAGNKYGIRLAPIRHPEADTMAAVDAMVAPLLRAPHKSWEGPGDVPDQRDSTPTEKRIEVTARDARSDGEILSRVAQALCAEVDLIHQLRLGRTNSKPWKEELEAQLPADITSLRNAASETDRALSKLECEHHFSGDGLTTSFLARFDGDHEAAILALPKLVEEAAAAKQVAAAALSERRVDEAKAENSLIDGWLATHCEKLRAMRDEFAQPYDRQLVELTRLHDSPVAIAPWQETSYCGVLLTIVDATLTLLESERSMDNFMESDRLNRTFAHLDSAEWEVLTLNIRSEAARVPSDTTCEEAPSFEATTSHGPEGTTGSGAPLASSDFLPSYAASFMREQEDWLGPRPPDQILEYLQQQAPSVGLQVESSRAQWATLAVQLADMLALQNVDFATKQLARHLLDSSGLKDVSLVICCSWVTSDVPSGIRRAIEAGVEHVSNIITEKNCDLIVTERGLRAVAKVLGNEVNPKKKAPQDSPPTSANTFISKGTNKWEVRFQGCPEFILTGKGAAYLHRLIKHERKSIRATELQAQVAGQPESLLQGDAGEASDAQAMQNYRQRYKDLEESKEKATKNNDEAELARIKKEQAELASHISKDRGLGGRVRIEHDNEEKARKAVAAAITRTVRKIRDLDQALAEHFQAPTLQLGAELCYSPRESIQWAL